MANKGDDRSHRTDHDRAVEEHSTTKSTRHDARTEKLLDEAQDESLGSGDTRQSNRNRNRVDEN